MYDLAIIGGGPGGYVAAIRGAQHGLKVLLVEKDSLGGTCLNRGCIPTKCFIYDTKLLDSVKSSQVIKGAEGVSIDLARMVDRKNKTVKRLVNGLHAIMQSHSIDVVSARGEVIGPGIVRVYPPEGPPRDHKAVNIILASGSKPKTLPFVEIDGDLIQTTDQVFDMEEIPRKIVIIGGGVIGIEMATIFFRLGSQVTILEMLPYILSGEDEEIRGAMGVLLKRRGVEIHVGARATGVSISGREVTVNFVDKAGDSWSIRADKLLVAAGRDPVLDGTNHRQLGLAMEGGFIRVDDHLETNLKGVYAVGDLVGGQMLAHKASAEAEIVITNIAGGHKTLKRHLVPRCVWGVAEIGAVGLTEEEARKSGRQIKVGKFPFTSSGAAQALENTDGFVKVIADIDTGEVVGVHILGEHATDLIGEAVTAMTMEAVVEDFAEAIKPHPTLSEAVMEAAMDWSGVALHSPKKRTRVS